MQLEAVGRPLKYRLRTGEEIILKPGVPVELRDESARILLKQAGDRVRVVDSSVVIEPAHPNARPIYWERNDGNIYGPARLQFLAQVGLGLKTTDFCVVVSFDGGLVWIRSDRLRSRQQFEAQHPMSVVTLVKEPR